MLLLPNIDYGTEGYPEKVARRLRAVNLSAWILTVLSIGFAVAKFFDPAPGLWKAAVINTFAAAIFAMIPLLHRFGPLTAAVTLMVVGYIVLFIVIWLLGTGTGMAVDLLVTAACTVV